MTPEMTDPGWHRQLVQDASCAFVTRARLQELLARAAADEGFAVSALDAIAAMVTSGQVRTAQEALYRLCPNPVLPKEPS